MAPSDIHSEIICIMQCEQCNGSYPGIERSTGHLDQVLVIHLSSQACQGQHHEDQHHQWGG